MPESRVVRWSGSTNSPNARDYFEVIERPKDSASKKARGAFFAALVKSESAATFVEIRCSQESEPHE